MYDYLTSRSGAERYTSDSRFPFTHLSVRVSQNVASLSLSLSLSLLSLFLTLSRYVTTHCSGRASSQSTGHIKKETYLSIRA